MNAPRKPLAVELRDAAILRDAAHFRVMIFLGRGRFEYAPDQADLTGARIAATALEAAHPPRRAMIYAVNAAGRSTMWTPRLAALAQGGAT